MFTFIFVLLVLLFVVAPFVLGFFPQGQTWVLLPVVYVQKWLLLVEGFGTQVKAFLSKV